MSDRIKTVVINYQTPDLLKIAVESFRNFYPTISLLIIDNGSKDDSREIIEKIRQAAPKQTSVLLLDSNMYHGPAMHRAMSEGKEEFVFFLDSDTETKQGGFLEKMQLGLETSGHAYGIGRRLIVNKRGFQTDHGINLLAPAYMMIRRRLYSLFPHFEHHGMPILKNCVAALEQGYELKIFPIEEFIEHRWRGTASRFGYGLGWKSKVDYVLNKIGL